MNYDDNTDEPGFFQRHRIAVTLGAVVLLGGVGFAAYKMLGHSGDGSARRAPDVMMVRLTPPPPPPKPLPPPPKPEQIPPPQQQEKMTEVASIPDEVKPPENEPPPEEPAANPLAVDAAGSGPGDAFGLVGQPGVRGIGGGGTGSGIGGRGGYRGGKFDYYFSQVRKQIKSALDTNPKTNKANINLTVRIWADANGRVERAVLVGTTGDPELDTAIREEVLHGLQMDVPPPRELQNKMPIVLNLKAIRPQT